MFLALLLVAVAAATAVGLRGGEERADLDRPGPRPDVADEAEAAAGLLTDLRKALTTGDRAALEEAAGETDGPALRELRSLSANVRDLRIDRLALRYVDGSDLALSPAERSRYGEDAWVADVQLTWRFGGVEPTPSTLEVPVVMSWQDGEAVFETARVTQEQRVPLWLLARVVARSSPTTLVLATDRASAASLSRQAASAVDAVRGTLPRWRGPLVVEAPATDEQFEAAAGMSAESAQAIAAVTTTTDGSGLPSSPVHVYVNPAVFEPLGAEGRQIVISHEAAHVALGAATTPMPLWLSEGMADYVALAESELPVAVLASQIRRLVRDQGVPDQLPGPAEFNGANQDIGAWYEAAWLAARLLAEQHGEPALLELYRRADRSGSTSGAFKDVLGITEGQFVRDWRSYLRDLAGRS